MRVEPTLTKKGFVQTKWAVCQEVRILREPGGASVGGMSESLCRMFRFAYTKPLLFARPALMCKIRNVGTLVSQIHMPVHKK